MTSREERLEIIGPVAQDKDLARSLRLDRILPALEARRRIVLDFSSVTTATQSFLHACLSEAFRRYGEELVEELEFYGCQDDVRELIGTVVEYSLRARTLTQEGLSGSLKKVDVPQADNLSLVRVVLDSIASGMTSPEHIVWTTGFSQRHVHYRLHSARILGFANIGTKITSLTDRGRSLVATTPGTGGERTLLVTAIQDSQILKKLCPTLLAIRAPSQKELARRLQQKTGLSTSTAMRRAQTLLSWRRTLLTVQTVLPGFSMGGS